jgi:hypothetical protein
MIYLIIYLVGMVICWILSGVIEDNLIFILISLIWPPALLVYIFYLLGRLIRVLFKI